MRINQYGQVQISEAEAFTALYNKKIVNLQDVYLEDSASVDLYNNAIEQNADKMAQLAVLLEPVISVEEFDQNNQINWFISPEYVNFDIIEWLYNKCSTKEQKARVGVELELFAQHGMYELLIYLKYLVDTMRQHKVLWGVGRGSSVSSYCLFLIGVHKIDSLKYNLSINEFLK